SQFKPRMKVLQRVTRLNVSSSYPNHPAGCMTEKERVAKSIMQRIKNMTCLLQNLVALRREANAVGHPFEQLHAQALFQLHDRGSDRRLRHMHLASRLGELAGLRRRNEVSQLAHRNIILCHLFSQYLRLVFIILRYQTIFIYSSQSALPCIAVAINRTR